MTSTRQVLLFVGIGKIGGAHLETALRRMRDGVYHGYKIGIVSGREEIRNGDLSSLPEVMNLGVNIRRQIEPELMQHIVVYESVEQALDDDSHDIDAAIICRDTNEHAALAQQLRAQSVHVLVEKPLAMLPDEAHAAVTNHAGSSTLNVAHELYFFGQFGCLVNTVAAGTYGPEAAQLGAFQHGQMSRMVKNSDPSIGDPSRKEKCRSAFFDLFVHDGHLSMLMFGRPDVVLVLDYRTHPDDGDFLTWAKVELRWEDGSRITIEAGTFEDDEIEFAHSFSFDFAEGAIAMDDNDVVVHSADDPVVLELPETVVGDDTESLAAEQDLFFAHCAGQRLDERVQDANLALDTVVLADLLEKLALCGCVNQETPVDWL